MQITAHPYTLLLLSSALVSGVMAFLIWGRRMLKGALALAALMFELAVWAGASAMMWSSPVLDTQVFWLNATYFGALTVPITFFVFAMQITDNDRWLTKRSLLLLGIEPLITFFVIWTNQFHYLFHANYKMTYVNNFPELSWTHGPWFWLNSLYSYAVILVSITVLLRAFMRAGPYFRMQLGTVLIGGILPLAANIYAIFLPNPLKGLDITPLSFAVSGLIFAHALFRQGLLDILPIARSVLIEKITDGVLVLDMNGRVLDINPAAQRVFSVNGSVHGKDIRILYPQWTDLVDRFLKEKEMRFEIRSRTDESIFYDLIVAPLVDNRGRDNGRLITFRDVSEKKRFETELEKMNERLRLQLHKISLLRDALREQTIRDPLTGLFNRRYLTETLERELSLAKRKGYSVSVIMIDIDQFKRVNDTYGHKAGDQVLKALGKIIQSRVRSSDIPCRFGGEEFVIVMPETTVEIAVQRANQIRSKFRSMKFFGGGDAIIPTLSIGVAAFPTHGSNLEEIVQGADQAMYNAKALRNTVMVYGEKSLKRHKDMIVG
ncbi:MAG: diguanylate cyclase [Chloroflexi bacterium]|nr:diguanylate cyclase [Chloroflexota bacterium]